MILIFNIFKNKILVVIVTLIGVFTHNQIQIDTDITHFQDDKKKNCDSNCDKRN